ncbi:MAG: hypothetical protein ACLTM8_00005, partial [Veillonella parvula]
YYLSSIVRHGKQHIRYDILMELAELMSFLCKWSVRICAGAFVFIMSVISDRASDVAVIAGKTIKTAAGQYLLSAV